MYELGKLYKFTTTFIEVLRCLSVLVPQIAAVEEDGREDKATIKCETSPPPTPRTVRMTHTLPASSHNDARGWV